jgi:uncharacterized DUF497 family protein
MTVRVTGFEWDEHNWPKCGKHGVARTEIEVLFGHHPAIYPDPAHSRREQRMLAVGRSARGRFILVAFTLRESDGEARIRPISARYMHEKEIRHYEAQRQAQKPTDADQ